MYSLSQLKTDNGIIRTKSLFYELSYDDPDFALFTLKEEDIVMPNGKSATALGKLYIAFATMDLQSTSSLTQCLGVGKYGKKCKQLYHSRNI